MSNNYQIIRRISINLCNALKLPKKLVKAIKNMGKSKIWHDMKQAPPRQNVSIYLIDDDKYISLVFYSDEGLTPWVNYCIYYDAVAWAYVDDILNL